MKRALTISILALVAISLVSADEVIEPDKIMLYKTVGDVELKLDIFEPSGHTESDKKPAIVFFFGGGWKKGSTKAFYRQAHYLSTRGMVAICSDYRTESRHGTKPFECVKDGKSAMRWVRKNAEKLGIDPNRIAAAGGSAGGHVAAATATLKGFNEEGEDTSISCVPNALVLFNPVYDNSPEGYGNDRIGDCWREFSPMHNITEAAPPTVVFFGTEDKLVPVETAKKYKQLMEDAGSRCDLHLYEGQPHAFFNRAKFYETLLEADKFLISLGYLDGEPTLKPDQYDK